MMYTKKILCLANSRKPPSGRCVAGREVVENGFGPWHRPVSTRVSEEISEEERRYENGQDPQVLDIISIPLSKPNPCDHQTENHVIDAECYWERKGAVSWGQLQGAIEVVGGPLWQNGYSTYYGTNDRVPQRGLTNLRRSLYLVQPRDLVITVVTEGEEFGNPRRRVRAQFTLDGSTYSLFVTDPVIERQYWGPVDGRYQIDQAVLCVSLGGLHDDGYAYKLVAAVITPDRAGGEG
ncbi:MAG: dual OB domain-containing protein [Thermodesulfobacteriota bacterium]